MRFLSIAKGKAIGLLIMGGLGLCWGQASTMRLIEGPFRDDVSFCRVAWEEKRQEAVVKNAPEVEVSGLHDAKLRQAARRILVKARDSVDAAKGLDEWLGTLVWKGWAEAALGSLHFDSLRRSAHIHLGPRYRIGEIAIKGAPSIVRMAFDNLPQSGNPLVWADMQQKLQQALYQAGDMGYPFARLDSLTIAYQQAEEGEINADLGYRFDPGPLVRIDSILIKGKKREKDELVYALIGLRPGDLYHRRLISEIPQTLNNSPYFQSVKPVVQRFSPQKNTVSLEIQLTQKRSGHMDILLGLLPPSEPGSGKVQFTGLVDVSVVSPFVEMGEKVDFIYKKLTATSQQLLLGYAPALPFWGAPEWKCFFAHPQAGRSLAITLFYPGGRLPGLPLVFGPICLPQ